MLDIHSKQTDVTRNCPGHNFVANSRNEVTCSICEVPDDEMPQFESHCEIEIGVKPDKPNI